MAMNFEPKECVILVQSAKIGTLENTANHSIYHILLIVILHLFSIIWRYKIALTFSSTSSKYNTPVLIELDTSPSLDTVKQYDTSSDNKYYQLWKIVAAFRGMHMLPAKHSYTWLPRKCDCGTDRRMDRQTPDKVIPMCHYASQVTQKGFQRNTSWANMAKCDRWTDR